MRVQPRVALVLSVVALGSFVDAQTVSRLDDPLTGELRIDRPSVVPPCTVAMAVSFVARHAKIPAGFENTADCNFSPRALGPEVGDVVFTGMTARQAFDHLMELMPGYLWREIDGVVVVRPVSAWVDTQHVLNRPTAPFAVTSASADDHLHALLKAVSPSVFYPHTDLHESAGALDAVRAMTFDGGKMLDALNGLVRARDAEWEIGYNASGRPRVVVHTLAFGRGAVMAPLALPAR
jgi:hypothetical protein